MSNALKLRAKRNGIRSKYAGDEPRRDELTAHLPKVKIKRHRFPSMSKRTVRLRHKARVRSPVSFPAPERAVGKLARVKRRQRP